MSPLLLPPSFRESSDEVVKAKKVSGQGNAWSVVASGVTTKGSGPGGWLAPSSVVASWVMVAGDAR